MNNDILDDLIKVSAALVSRLLLFEDFMEQVVMLTMMMMIMMSLMMLTMMMMMMSLMMMAMMTMMMMMIHCGLRRMAALLL